ncbi:hypothetical protein AX17_001331 [Amanita inopinata Kibby_2008]|nr:hypothetical protein AX17_001331 [Amanita inopinata Kibby_2008]
MSTDQVTLPGDGGGSSGTSVTQIDHIPENMDNIPAKSEGGKVSGEGEEQALESHEVIELQTFSERKAWIEEKIKFLERMPPIEVFVGLDAIRASAEHVPGLPTRGELQQWMAEHDAIEKETEIFDKGELKKLRQLTKAATQRNLSPEDTDIIELTLTTIYELDRLLHLLRNRSENLELLNIRLTWEEHRIVAWIDLRKLLDDLKTFITTRARWTPSVYDVMTKEETHDIKRRGSIASMASAASDSSFNSGTFSRGARFKLAELLSRDAAQFAARIASLRHGKITASGKVLDKLIDMSRKPVPEILLDEQDKLEEKGMNEIEHVGKFIMNLVMQWRKADEIYVETKKDQLTAQNLFEEIETAKLHHPTARQSASFISRAEALLKRLSVRGNPASSNSSFPRPEHFLFMDQNSCNITLITQLATEISHATALVQRVDAAAKEYRKTHDAVKRAEALLQEVNGLANQFASITERLLSGVSNDEGDGSAPNLNSEACLEPTAHSVYLALLPDILDQATKANGAAVDLLGRSRSVILALESPGVDPLFKSSTNAGIEKLDSQRNRAQSIRDDVVGRVYRMKEARKIWGCMGGILTKLDEIRGQVEDAMEKYKWRQQSTHGAPLTPDSPPATPVTATPTHSELLSQLIMLEPKLSQDVESPFIVLSYTLESAVKEWLGKRILGLKNTFDAAKQMIDVLDSIQAQAAAMTTIRDECNSLQVSMEDLQIRLRGSIADLLAERISRDDMVTNEETFQAETSAVESKVKTFVQGLLRRVPFVERQPASPSGGSNYVKRRYSSLDPKSGLAQQGKAVELPFELSSLDDAVRADCNSYTITLSGKVESVMQLTSHLKLARISKEVESASRPLLDDVNGIVQSLNEQKVRFANLAGEIDKLDQLIALLEDVEQSSNIHRTRISRSLSFIRESIRRMQESPGAQDPAVHESLLLSRIRAVDDVELRFNSWYEDVTLFKDQISVAQRQELQRMEELRRAEEHRQQEESRRIAAEVAERTRLEQERLVNEKLRKIEEERLAEVEKQRLEKQRAAAEEAEREVLERQRRETEEQQRLEKQRLTEEKRAEEERLRQAAEEAEKAQLQRERMEVEMKLRQVEEQLATERRITAERDEKERLEAEQRKKEAEQEKRRIQEEQERLEAKVRQRRQKEEERRRLLDQDDLSFSLEHAIELTVIDEESNKSFVTDEEEDEDVFGFRLAPDVQKARSPEILELQAKILELRKRLRKISISEALRPSKASTKLPTKEKVAKLRERLVSVSDDVARLPSSVEDFTVDTELRSLRTEVEASYNLLKSVTQLSDLSSAIKACEGALSDLLEHVDSYPSPPLGVLSTSYEPSMNLPPEKQLSARLTFTRKTVTDMNAKLAPVKDDARAIAESSTVQQTWAELEEMTTDRIGGKRTRPSSVIGSRPSSGRNSSASVFNTRATTSKRGSYSSLSVSSNINVTRGHLAPPSAGGRRAVSGGAESSRLSRPPSQLSGISNNRPPKSFSPSVYGTTFASRQRTSSLSNSISTPPNVPEKWARSQGSQGKRAVSPALSESSTLSRSIIGTSRTSSSAARSSWSRAPRNSLSSFILPRATSPPKPKLKKPLPPAPTSGPRKKYIPDPKSKLDVAVGDVVNKLPVGINVEGVTDSWRDKSGKYWIGNQDPKLCFCRILRSHTVMVRVGGGWAELSTFIEDHFAESFRIMHDSPPKVGAKEEKWISSVALLEQAEENPTPPQGLVPPRPPSTPEPSAANFLPSFAITTPTGRSPHSISSPSTKGGSPLTPMQFIRRADYDPTTHRPLTPSKPPPRARNAPPTPTPSNHNTKQGVWRP